LVADDAPRLDEVEDGIAGGALDHSHGERFRFLEHCQVLRDKHLPVEFDSHGLVEIDLGDHCLNGGFNHNTFERLVFGFRSGTLCYLGQEVGGVVT